MIHSILKTKNANEAVEEVYLKRSRGNETVNRSIKTRFGIIDTSDLAFTWVNRPQKTIKSEKM